MPMTLQEQALGALAMLLDRERIPYMVIGGIANAVWGEPRATLDIDVTVWVGEREIPGVARAIAESFVPLVPDVDAFIARTRVLPLRDANGVRVDLIFGLLPFEEEAIRRALPVVVGETSIRFATAEDLILMKIISEREQDQRDARGIALRRMAELDLGYLEPRVRELASLLESPEIEDRWEAWKMEAEAIK